MNLVSQAVPSRTALKSSLKQGLTALEIRLDSGAIGQLIDYLTLLEKWNRVYNLTAVRDPAKMVSHHLLDSLAILPQIEGTARLLDVGSGAGFPGMPLAIARPDCSVTLLDSSHKKAAFLRQAVAELGLGNVAVVCERVETWRAEPNFDLIVSRALADLGEFAGQSSHLLAAGGRFAAMKGLYPFEEIERLPKGIAVRSVVKLEVPGLRAERHLVIMAAL